jgi:hypothetical protein
MRQPNTSIADLQVFVLANHEQPTTTASTWPSSLRSMGVCHYQIGDGVVSGWIAVFMGDVCLKVRSVPGAQFNCRPGKANLESTRGYDEVLGGSWRM